jgi:hypothetical protein
MNNARAKTLLEKPSFKQLVADATATRSFGASAPLEALEAPAVHAEFLIDSFH